MPIRDGRRVICTRCDGIIVAGTSAENPSYGTCKDCQRPKLAFPPRRRKDAGLNPARRSA